MSSCSFSFVRFELTSYSCFLLTCMYLFIRRPLPAWRVRIDGSSCSSRLQTDIYFHNSHTAQTAPVSNSQILRLCVFLRLTERPLQPDYLYRGQSGRSRPDKILVIYHYMLTIHTYHTYIHTYISYRIMLTQPALRALSAKRSHTLQHRSKTHSNVPNRFKTLRNVPRHLQTLPTCYHAYADSDTIRTYGIMLSIHTISYHMGLCLPACLACQTLQNALITFRRFPNASRRSKTLPNIPKLSSCLCLLTHIPYHTVWDDAAQPA